jgi:hypothetical protein
MLGSDLMPGRWLKIKRHRDGTVSYFSDLQNKWIMNVTMIPEKELESMGSDESRLLLKFLAKKNSQKGI